MSRGAPFKVRRPRDDLEVSKVRWQQREWNASKDLKISSTFFHRCTSLAGSGGVLLWERSSSHSPKETAFEGSIFFSLDPLQMQRGLQRALILRSLSVRAAFQSSGLSFDSPRLAPFLRLLLSPLLPTSYCSEQTITRLVWVLLC